MAKSREDLLDAHARRHDALIDSTVAQFDRGLQPILSRAQAALTEELRGQLTIVDGRIIRDRATQKALRAIRTRFPVLMREEGYKKHLDSLQASFGRQFPMFDEVLEILGVPKVTWSAADKRLFDDQAKASVLVLDELVQTVASSAYRSALLQIGGLAPRRLATLIADETGKTAPQASAIADTATTVYYRSIAARGYDIIEKQEGELHYQYFGPRDKLNRPFCRHVLDLKRALTRDEIAKLKNPAGTDVFTNAGGWRCRHQWAIVPPEKPKDFAERPQDIPAYIRGLRDQWKQTLADPAAHDAVVAYSGSDYTDMNGSFRRRKVTNRTTRLVAEMRRAFVWEIEEPLMVYRGDSKYLPSDHTKPFEFQGFLSTSLDPSRAMRFSGTLARIRLDRGQLAVPINGDSQHPSEHELILPPETKLIAGGTSSVRIGGKDVQVVDFEVVKSKGKRK